MRDTLIRSWHGVQAYLTFRITLAVAWKEIQTYFTSPMGYIVALVFLSITGFFFVLSISDAFSEASVDGYISPSAFVLVLLAPAMTMRLFAEEQKLGTLELLLTSPVRDWELVLGKFLASLSFFMVTLALTLFYVFLLYYFGSPDFGPIWSSYLGLILYGAACLSVGLLASSITNNQIVAMVVGFGVLLILSVIDQASSLVGGTTSTVLEEMGLVTHLTDFTRGVVDTSHIVYYLTVTAVFLFLAVRSLESRRWR